MKLNTQRQVQEDQNQPQKAGETAMKVEKEETQQKDTQYKPKQQTEETRRRKNEEKQIPDQKAPQTHNKNI